MHGGASDGNMVLLFFIGATSIINTIGREGAGRGVASDLRSKFLVRDENLRLT